MAASNSATVISATASALRAGVFSTGMPAAVAPGMSTLFGSPRVDATARRASSKTGPFDRITLHHNDIGAFSGDALRQLLGAVDAQRRLIELTYPRVVDDVDELLKLGEPRPAQRGRHQGAWSRRHGCQCWRTVAPVSREDVTIGIDVGTHGDQGGCGRRERPRARPGTHSASAAGAGPRSARARRRRGMAAGSVGCPGPAAPSPRMRNVKAVAVSSMVPSMTAVDSAGHALDTGAAVRRRAGPGARGPRATAYRRWVRPQNFCAGRPRKRPKRPGTGRRRPLPTTRWPESR